MPNGPPLQVPEPPPHVLVPVEEAVITAPVPAPAPETPPPPASAPRTPPRPAAESRPPSAPPPPSPAQTEPPRELRAAPSSTNAATERSVRDVLARALRDLNRVNYGRLSTEGRATYDQSKRFSQQAEEALKERNVVFAATLADKAATLAAELLNR